jgi:hypothetical protein
MQTDIVYFHVFNDLLKDGRWDFRWSIGPTFHFGRNVREAKAVSRAPLSSSPNSQSNP